MRANVCRTVRTVFRAARGTVSSGFLGLADNRLGEAPHLLK